MRLKEISGGFGIANGYYPIPKFESLNPSGVAAGWTMAFHPRFKFLYVNVSIICPLMMMQDISTK